MKIKILHKDILSLKKHLDGKKRIMTYGAGIFANDIKKILDGYGYKLDYAVVDSQYCDGNTFLDKNEGGGVDIYLLFRWKRSFHATGQGKMPSYGPLRHLKNSVAAYKMTQCQ